MFTNLSVPGAFAPFLDLNRNGCGNSAGKLVIAYHYAFDTPTRLFLSNGKHSIFSSHYFGTSLFASIASGQYKGRLSLR